MFRSFKIWIKDKKTFERVLKQMDEDGVRWYMSRDCASSHIDRHKVPIALFVDSDNELSWGDNEKSFKDHEYCEITPEEYLKENKTMTKADLKDWMIVEDNLERRYLVDKIHNVLLEYGRVAENNTVLTLDGFTDDLYRRTNDLYIIRAFKPSATQISYIFDGLHPIVTDPVWEREEPAAEVEMTVAEIEEKLGIKNLKIVKE